MKYYIIAGEASGDLHGANLMRALLRADANAEVRFWGGDLMAAAAQTFPQGHTTQVRHIRDLAYMGLVEVASHLPVVLGNIRFCKRDIKEYRPDVMVFIDYPGFNLKIAKFTHRQGIKNLYYISPQIWAWKKGRIRPMRRDLDKLCYILPTEQRFYAENSFPQATYVGHPLLDEVENYHQRMSQQPATGMSSAKPVVALLPGSRKQELRRTIPLMAKVARKHPEYCFKMAGMTLIGSEFYRSLLPSDADIEMVFDSTYDLLSESYAALVCSGTATLETALFRVPEVVCYQCNKLTEIVARPLIGKRIRFISLVNLIADRKVVTELIQGDFNIQQLDKEFRMITEDAAARQTMLESYDEVAKLLGGVGASERTAMEIVKLAAKDN